MLKHDMTINFWMGKLLGKWSLGRPVEDGIKMDVGELGFKI